MRQRQTKRKRRTSPKTPPQELNAFFVVCVSSCSSSFSLNAQPRPVMPTGIKLEKARGPGVVCEPENLRWILLIRPLWYCLPLMYLRIQTSHHRRNAYVTTTIVCHCCWMNELYHRCQFYRSTHCCLFLWVAIASCFHQPARSHHAD
jgi:hypothetical protein